MARLTLIIFGLSLFPTFGFAETAELTMRFIYDGDTSADAPGGEAAFDKRMFINPTDNGIRDTVVYVYTGRGGSKLDQAPYDGKMRRLEIQGGRLDPRILIARAGDTLEFLNHDRVGYNLNLNFFSNPPQNVVVAADHRRAIVIESPEPGLIPVSCNIHPQTQSKVLVLDHSFAAVSDKEGTIKIEGLPANTPLVFQTQHAAGRIGQVEINGTKEIWGHGRFEIRLEPGPNDLGDILVSADAFQ